MNLLKFGLVVGLFAAAWFFQKDIALFVVDFVKTFFIDVAWFWLIVLLIVFIKVGTHRL